MGLLLSQRVCGAPRGAGRGVGGLSVGEASFLLSSPGPDYVSCWLGFGKWRSCAQSSTEGLRGWEGGWITVYPGLPGFSNQEESGSGRLGQGWWYMTLPFWGLGVLSTMASFLQTLPVELFLYSSWSLIVPIPLLTAAFFKISMWPSSISFNHQMCLTTRLLAILSGIFGADQ